MVSLVSFVKPVPCHMLIKANAATNQEVQCSVHLEIGNNIHGHNNSNLMQIKSNKHTNKRMNIIISIGLLQTQLKSKFIWKKVPFTCFCLVHCLELKIVVVVVVSKLVDDIQLTLVTYSRG